MRGMSQRQNDARNAQSNALGRTGEHAEIHEGIKHLAGITERRHVERHVTQPDRRIAERFGQPHPLEMPLQRRHGAGAVVLQRHDQSQTQPVRPKHCVVSAIDRLE